MKNTFLRWCKRILIGIALLIFGFFFLVLPIGGSFLITNSHFKYPERGPKTAAEAGIDVTPVTFHAADGVQLEGWWSPGDLSKPVIIFCHGLNRSRLELLQRAAEIHRQGFGVLLFDLRNHGDSARAHTTLGIDESMDACAASQLVREKAGSQPQVLWGVSMGASTAILAAKRCPGFRAIISDSSFLSFRETISHHVELLFHLPSFPIANLIVGITEIRLGLNPDDGDVEAAVRTLGGVPILFIAGGNDKRMPPALAERLRSASSNARSEMLLVPGASHGEAYNINRTLYMNAVSAFLSRAL